jgi:hypothetical protein
VLILWFNLQLIQPISEIKSFRELAIREGFEGLRHGTGIIIVGIDARWTLPKRVNEALKHYFTNFENISTWFYECQAAFTGRGRVHSNAGLNPELRVLFFRLAELSRSTAQAVFVFDGPRRPRIKRGKAVRAYPHWLTSRFTQLAKVFGFHCHTVYRTTTFVSQKKLLITARLLVKLKLN